MKSVVRIAAILSCVALAAPVAARADDAATVKGKWTVASKALELGHARGFREPDPFGKGTNPCLLLSNLPVPDAAVPADDDGVSELLDLVRSGELRALQVCFEGDGKSLRRVNDVFTFHPGVSPGRFGLQGFCKFAPKAAAGRIAGRLTGSGTTMDDAPWSVDVELSAPIPAE